MADNESSATCLQGTFQVYSKVTLLLRLKVSQDGLQISPAEDTSPGRKPEMLLKAADLLGCLCMKSDTSGLQSHAYFTVYAYPIVDGKRRRNCHTFVVSTDDCFEKNLEVANRWRSAIYYCIWCHYNGIVGNVTSEVSNARFKNDRKLLVLINPNSGPGQALQIFKRQVAPVFGEAEVPHKVIVTNHAGHGCEIVTNMALDEYAGVIIVSGDGLLYEVYNGLMKRPDWKKALQIPIGIIPGGSGNGLARSLAYYINEPYLKNPILVSALNVVYGRVTPMDLVLVETGGGKKIMSFLSFGFGLLSDIDIESERLRVIGESRFTVWAFVRALNLRRYHAKVWYKRAAVSNILSSSNAGSGASPLFVHTKKVPEGVDVVKQTEGNGIAIDDLETQQETNGNLVKSIYLPVDGLESETDRILGDDVGKDLSSHLWPPMDGPVPTGWEMIEDDFVMVYAVYETHIGTDVFFAPKSLPNDGIIWLVLASSKLSRMGAMKFLLSLDTGGHLNIPGVTAIAVESVRIEPIGCDGNMTVDGEKVDFGRLQATVLPSAARMMVR